MRQKFYKNSKKLNRTKRAKQFDSFDFSTLYTNIPHEAYRIRGEKYLVIKNNGTTYWSNIASTKYHNITEKELVQQIKFLIENIYIQVGKTTPNLKKK